MKIKVNNYLLENSKIKKDITILNLSDIHSNIKALDKIIDYIKNIHIDYILIPGDVVDILNLDNEKEFLEKVINLSKYAPTYMVIGNHDKYLGKRLFTNIETFKQQNFYKTLSKVPTITLFVDEFNHIDINDHMSISSFVFPNDYYYKKEKVEDFNKFIKKVDKLDNLDNNKFNILLAHSPNKIIQNKHIINYSKIINKTNLILCGHNHGGLTPTFIQDIFNNHTGFFGPYTVFIQRNAYGAWSDNDKNLLVSNGVTKLANSSSFKFLHKIANSILIPEIDIINLRNGNNNFKLINRKKYK